MQTNLAKPKLNYSYGPYNKIGKTEQWIRITEGCPWDHEYCYEPKEIKIFDIPNIERNHVKIMDMNLLCKPESLNIINYLGSLKINKKVVYYELVCGIDFRFLTQEIADALYKNRFKNIRIAWDMFYSEQLKIHDAIKMLYKAGYERKDIMVFMICNWQIKFSECLKKLDLCKIWNVQVADCYFDNQVFPNVQPIYWSYKECHEFRQKVRKHNQLINFGVDPEI